ESEGRCLCGAIAGLCREIGCQGESGSRSIERDIPELDRPQPDQCLNPVGVAGREVGDQSWIRRVRLERVVAQRREGRYSKCGGPIRGVAREPHGPNSSDRAGAVMLQSTLRHSRYLARRFSLTGLNAGQSAEKRQDEKHLWMR